MQRGTRDSVTLLHRLLAAAPSAKLRDDGVDLLRKLLSIAPKVVHAPTSSLCEGGLDLLRKLLSVAPKTIRAPRRLTLFEALHVLDLENPHSDLLAWLLDPSGPLTDMWLLRSLFARIAPNEKWPGTPIVEREVSVDSGRADIVVSWDSFKIVVENKIWSPEGDLQIHRYLDGFKIIDGAHGRVVYLTPRRQWPRGVAKGDDRVVAMSYYDLAELLDVGLQSDKERHERGRVFAKEFVDGIHRLLKLRIEMTKPPLSEATKLLLAHGKQFAELKQAAIDESGEFIQWLFFEAGRRLKAVLGPDMEKLSWGDSIYCYLPSWKIGEGVFGIAFAMRADPQNRFIAEHPEGPWVSVGIIQPDGSELKSVCQPICDRLHEALRKVWPYAEDLAAPSYSFPLWRYVPVPSDGDLNGWADEVLRLMEEMATALAPALTKAAAGAKPVE